MSFQGWPPAALEFYRGLEADNSKAYWLAHKGVYERDVKAPMDALLACLTEEFGEVHLFRPYRDIRFSADKSPYKTAIAATVGSMYVHLSAQGLRAGGGMYHMAPDQLDRYRDAVAADEPGEELRDIVDALIADGIEVYGSDPLKSAPKGHDRDHPRVELLRYRGIVAMKAWPAARWLATPRARQRVVDVFRTAAPLAAGSTIMSGQHRSPPASGAAASVCDTCHRIDRQGGRPVARRRRSAVPIWCR